MNFSRCDLVPLPLKKKKKEKGNWLGFWGTRATEKCQHPNRIWLKEGRKEGGSHGWEDNKRVLFTILLINMSTVSSDVSIQRRHWQPLSVHFFMSLTTEVPQNPWCEWCVKVAHITGFYVQYSFRTVVWVLLRLTRRDRCKCCETVTTIFHA